MVAVAAKVAAPSMTAMPCFGGDDLGRGDGYAIAQTRCDHDGGLSRPFNMRLVLHRRAVGGLGLARQSLLQLRGGAAKPVTKGQKGPEVWSSAS